MTWTDCVYVSNILARQSDLPGTACVTQGRSLITLHIYAMRKLIQRLRGAARGAAQDTTYERGEDKGDDILFPVEKEMKKTRERREMEQMKTSTRGVCVGEGNLFCHTV